MPTHTHTHTHTHVHTYIHTHTHAPHTYIHTHTHNTHTPHTHTHTHIQEHTHTHTYIHTHTHAPHTYTHAYIHTHTYTHTHTHKYNFKREAICAATRYKLTLQGFVSQVRAVESGYDHRRKTFLGPLGRADRQVERYGNKAIERRKQDGRRPQFPSARQITT